VVAATRFGPRNQGGDRQIGGCEGRSTAAAGALLADRMQAELSACSTAGHTAAGTRLV